MSSKRILLIPDAYLGDYSGAYVAQIAKRLIQDMGHCVAVFTAETDSFFTEEDGTEVYPQKKFNSLAYWKESDYIRNYNYVLDCFHPEIVFTLGSVTNKPVCYWRIARNRGIKTISKIFMKDFF